MSRDVPAGMDDEEIATSKLTGVRFLARRDNMIERTLIEQGRWEFPVHLRILALLVPGDTFVDVGANIGAHSCAAAHHVGPNGRVIAIEPISELAERLRRNCALNGLDNVTIVRKAAAAVRARRVLFAPKRGEENQGMGSFYSHEGESQTPIEVETEPLDEILKAVAVRRVRVMKIDVEGAELEVLRGARRTLERWRPHLVFEFHAAAWERAGATIDEVRQLLHGDFGYEVRRLPTGDESIYDLEAIPPAPRRHWGLWRR
jgi:FkbM family methyltransferase